MDRQNFERLSRTRHSLLPSESRKQRQRRRTVTENLEEMDSYRFREHIESPDQGAGSQGQGAGSLGQGAGSLGQGAGSLGQGAGSLGQGAGSRGLGAGSQGRGAGSPGRGAGSQGRGAGSRGRGAGSRGRGAGNQGRGTGNRGRGAGRRDQGAYNVGQGAWSVGQGARSVGQDARSVGQGAGSVGQGAGSVGQGAGSVGQGAGSVGQGAGSGGQGAGSGGQGAGSGGHGADSLGQGAGNTVQGPGNPASVSTLRESVIQYAISTRSQVMLPTQQNVLTDERIEADFSVPSSSHGVARENWLPTKEGTSERMSDLTLPIPSIQDEIPINYMPWQRYESTELEAGPTDLSKGNENISVLDDYVGKSVDKQKLKRSDALLPDDLAPPQTVLSSSSSPSSPMPLTSPTTPTSPTSPTSSTSTQNRRSTGYTSRFLFGSPTRVSDLTSPIPSIQDEIPINYMPWQRYESTELEAGPSDLSKGNENISVLDDYVGKSVDKQKLKRSDALLPDDLAPPQTVLSSSSSPSSPMPLTSPTTPTSPTSPTSSTSTQNKCSTGYTSRFLFGSPTRVTITVSPPTESESLPSNLNPERPTSSPIKISPQKLFSKMSIRSPSQKSEGSRNLFSKVKGIISPPKGFMKSKGSKEVPRESLANPFDNMDIDSISAYLPTEVTSMLFTRDQGEHSTTDHDELTNAESQSISARGDYTVSTADHGVLSTTDNLEVSPRVHLHSSNTEVSPSSLSKLLVQSIPLNKEGNSSGAPQAHASVHAHHPVTHPLLQPHLYAHPEYSGQQLLENQPVHAQPEYSGQQLLENQPVHAQPEYSGRQFLENLPVHAQPEYSGQQSLENMPVYSRSIDSTNLPQASTYGTRNISPSVKSKSAKVSKVAIPNVILSPSSFKGHQSYQQAASYSSVGNEQKSTGHLCLPERYESSRSPGSVEPGTPQFVSSTRIAPVSPVRCTPIIPNPSLVNPAENLFCQSRPFQMDPQGFQRGFGEHRIPRGVATNQEVPVRDRLKQLTLSEHLRIQAPPLLSPSKNQRLTTQSIVDLGSSQNLQQRECLSLQIPEIVYLSTRESSSLNLSLSPREQSRQFTTRLGAPQSPISVQPSLHQEPQRRYQSNQSQNWWAMDRNPVPQTLLITSSNLSMTMQPSVKSLGQYFSDQSQSDLIKDRPSPSFSSQPPPSPSYQPALSPSYQPALSPSYQPAPTSSYQPPPTSSYQPAPTAGYQPAPTAGYQPAPSVGYQPAPTAGYKPPPTASYQPTPSPSYQPAPTAGYQPTPSRSYQPAPTAGYQPTPSRSYQPAPTAGYQPTPSRSYQPAPTAGYQPTPSRSYQPAPTAGYQPAPSSGYQPTLSPSYQPAPSPGYRATSPGYRATSPGYRATSPGYRATSPGYRATSPGYWATSPGYRATSPGYRATSPGYRATSPGYLATSPGYRATSPGYRATSPGYRATSPGYGCHSPSVDHQPPHIDHPPPLVSHQPPLVSHQARPVLSVLHPPVQNPRE
ncbi:uncharacterized protein [Palaemon carinicauda]|uniref:uncharacterized protein isoform X2 n=1 Tax=Palaemon carinicauda TaxID=392227 RepID=UPI0035B57E8D